MRGINDDLQMLVLELLSLVAGDDDRNVAIDCNVLLCLGPWGLDRYEYVVSAEDFACFVVYLLACSEEAEIEVVFLVLITKVLLDRKSVV